MKEIEWLSCADPQKMFKVLRGSASDRKAGPARYSLVPPGVGLTDPQPLQGRGGGPSGARPYRLPEIIKFPLSSSRAVLGAPTSILYT
jgi:hypothetical protein